MDEFGFIKGIKQQTYKQSSVIKGIGDDAAVFRQSAMDVVTAVDTLVEDVHFSRKTMTPFYIGYRSLAANLSDIAAMGATPAYYLVSIVIPSSWSEDELNHLYNGMKSLATSHKMDLIGGDTVSGKELSLAITVFGYVPRNKARYRNAARNGDIIFVTGTLGDSAAGFHLLNHSTNYSDQAHYYNRHRSPTARLAFAGQLEGLERLALNDISDGIANEANEIAEASNVSLTIFEDKLPVSDSFGQFTKEEQYKWKLYGGEDFELLGAVPESDWDILEQIAHDTKTPLAAVGYAEFNSSYEQSVVLVDRDNKTQRLDKKGYTHLK